MTTDKLNQIKKSITDVRMGEAGKKADWTDAAFVPI